MNPKTLFGMMMVPLQIGISLYKSGSMSKSWVIGFVMMIKMDLFLRKHSSDITSCVFFLWSFKNITVFFPLLPNDLPELIHKTEQATGNRFHYSGRVNQSVERIGFQVGSLSCSWRWMYSWTWHPHISGECFSSFSHILAVTYCLTLIKSP